jgi:hypothetical protein
MQTSVKGDIWRAIRAGRLPAQRKDDGGFEIDPAELFRVFEPQRPDERPMEQDATASPEAPAADPRWACQEWQAARQRMRPPTLFTRGFHRAVQM